MATTTANLELTKPDMTDNVSPQGFNDNFDKIDEKITDLNTLTASSVVVAGDTEVWNGLKVKVVKRSGICQCTISGNVTSTASNGSKEAYITLPEGSRPMNFIQVIMEEQNGGKVIFRITTQGSLGVYWLLKDISTTGGGWYGDVTWVCA